jgi:hypothetical protein
MEFGSSSLLLFFDYTGAQCFEDFLVGELGIFIVHYT